MATILTATDVSSMSIVTMIIEQRKTIFRFKILFLYNSESSAMEKITS